MTGLSKLPPLAEIRKLIAYGAQVAGQAIALGLLHGAALHWTQLAVAAVGGYGIWKAKNAKAAPTP